MPISGTTSTRDDGSAKQPKRPSGERKSWRAGITIIAILGLIGGGIAVWESVEYRFIPKRFGVVIPGEIYRSGQISRWMFEPTVKKYGIDTVIDLNGVAKNDLNQQAEIASYETLDLNHYRIKLHGNGTGEVENYIEAIATLAKAHRNGETVLVHCHAGTQRTGSVLAAYQILVLGASPEAMYAKLQEYGWDPDSDQVLLHYLNGNMQRVAEALVERGIIESVPDPLPVVGP